MNWFHFMKNFDVSFQFRSKMNSEMLAFPAGQKFLFWTSCNIYAASLAQFW